MRSLYPLSSQELNDRIGLMYEHMVYLLGFHEPGYTGLSGFYEAVEASGEAHMASTSGLPHYAINEITGDISARESYTKLRWYLKADYLYKKFHDLISYEV